MTETLSERLSEPQRETQRLQALRPRPAINLDNAFFFESLNERGELSIQQCGECEELRHPPVPMCPECNSIHWAPKVMAGSGIVHSYVVLYHPIVPPFEPGYIVAVIELEEGPRVVMNLEGVDRADVQIGMPVTITAERMDENLVLPVARPAGEKQ
ncbi:Zn-ribbon domain-containing OB-fold protein [Pseudarthrobacter sp. H2]|uniref:Zn-ribbon domain-containing OB-fold protein n=1 Tax=Pseudarthrobacter sp. H2 TaxID=3418415 RepID=UPI003CEE3B33